jgi:hypothetical protein
MGKLKDSIKTFTHWNLDPGMADIKMTKDKKKKKAAEQAAELAKGSPELQRLQAVNRKPGTAVTPLGGI